MDTEKRRKGRIPYDIAAAAVTALTAVGLFALSGRLFGTHTFLRYDLYMQFAPFIRHFIDALFGGGPLDYSFEISMGMPTIPVYTYMCLSPFNLVFALIRDDNVAAAVAVILKLSLAAGMFQRFSARHLKHDGLSSVMFSLCYALCGYAITYYQDIMFLDGIYMLPLICGLVSELVKEGSWKRLTVAYAYIFTVHFYEGYLMGIFSGILLILLAAAKYKTQWKKYIACLLKLAGCALLAAMMGAAVLLPTACHILGHNVSTLTQLSLHLNLWDVYQNLFLGQMQTEDAIYPQIYCGLLVFYLTPCYFTEKKIEKKEKITAGILLGFLLVCSFFKPAYLMMHAFNVPDGCGFRFSYMYSFVLTAVCSRSWNYAGKLSRKKLTLFGLIPAAAYYIIMTAQKGYLPEALQSSSVLGWEINLVFLLAFGVLLANRQAKEKFCTRLMLALVCLELMVNGFFVNTRLGYNLGEYKVVYVNWVRQTEASIQEIEQYEAQRYGMYRIRYENVMTANQPVRYHYRGLGVFSTMENIRLRETMGRLGYYTSPAAYYDYGGTPVTEMIFGEKYTVTAPDPRVEWNGERLWRENPRALSIGYMVSPGVRDIVLSDNALENQNRLLSGLAGEEICCMEPVGDRYDTVTEGAGLFVYQDGEKTMFRVQRLEGAARGLVTFHVPSADGKQIYGYFPMELSVKKDDSPYLYSEADMGMPALRPRLSAPRCFALGSEENGDYTAVMEMNENTVGACEYQTPCFAAYDEAALEEAYRILSQNQMQVEEWQGDKISAIVEATGERPVLFTSIPYDDGWKVWVDGKETETTAVVNDTFLAVPLAAGTHQILFSYESAVNRIACAVSLGSILVFAAYCLQSFISKMSYKRGGR